MSVVSTPLKPFQSVTGPSSLDYLEAGYLLAFTVFLLTSWVAFTLAEFGLLEAPAVLALGLIALVTVTAVFLRRRWRPVNDLARAGLCVPLLIGVILFFPPDEWILGDLDPGSYVNAGAAIVEHHSISFRDPALDHLDPAVRSTLLASRSRLPGFYLVFGRFNGIVPTGIVVSPDRVVPHGFHLYPTVLALGFSVAGISSELLVTPLLALAGLAGYYLLVRRLFGTGVGTLAAFLLAIGPAEVWFARYPAAEILAQLLLFGGFLALVATVDTGSRWLAILAGASLGAAQLTKIELIPLPFLVAGYLGYEAMIGRFDRRWGWFLGSYIVLLLQAILHAVLIAFWYTIATLRAMVSPELLAAVGSAVALGLATGLALALVPSLRPRVRELLTDARLEAVLAWGLPASVALLALYAYFVRPLGMPPLPAAEMSPAQVSEANALQSFPRLGWFVTPPGLLLGTVGWMLLAYQARHRRAALPLLAIAVDTLVFLQDERITPIYYWAARRWLTLVIPGFCLAIAYLLVHLVPRQRKRLAVVILPVGCTIVLTYGLLQGIKPLLGYVEYRGAIEQLGRLASVLPPNAVVLFADGDSGQRFSTPMEYLFGRTSFLITNGASADFNHAVRSAARRWQAEGHPVYWVTTSQLPGPAEIGMSGTVVARQTISLPEKLATRSEPPGRDGSFRQFVVVYRLGISDPRTGVGR